MSKFNAGKASILVLTAVFAVAAFLLGRSITKVSAITQICYGNCSTVEFNAQHNVVDVAGHYVYESRTYNQAVYDCDLTVDIHGTNYNVSEFYIKPTGDDHHCHRIVWDDLSDSAQHDFKDMHHNDHDYGTGSGHNHGNWGSAYNHHIDEQPDAHLVTPAGYSACSSGYSIDPGDETKCRKWIEPTYETEYFSKNVTYIADGGSCYLPSAPSQGIPEWALGDYNELSQETDRPTISCPVDVCPNLEGNQATVPDGDYINSDNFCVPKIHVCTDATATNYDSNFNETNEVSDPQECLYGTRRWCSPTTDSQSGFIAIAVPTNQYPPKTGKPWVTGMDRYCVIASTPVPTPLDVCPNIDGVQTSIPDGLHMDGGGINCVSFSQAGPPPQGPYTPQGQVLGASTGTGGQVLGAKTLAGTGSFAENLYIAIMGLGGIITALGVKNFKKAI